MAEFVENDIGIRLTPIPGRHYAFGVLPVTNAQFRQWRKNHDSTKPLPGCFSPEQDVDATLVNHPDHPVVCVAPQSANQFCQWLSKQDEAVYRLPTFQEWAHAALTDSQEWLLNDRDRHLDRAGTLRNGVSLSVNDAPANPWGLRDMFGNVNEWVSDVAAEDYAYCAAWEKARKGVTVGKEAYYLGEHGLWEDHVGFRVVCDFTKPFRQSTVQALFSFFFSPKTSRVKTEVSNTTEASRSLRLQLMTLVSTEPPARSLSEERHQSDQSPPATERQSDDGEDSPLRRQLGSLGFDVHDLRGREEREIEQYVLSGKSLGQSADRLIEELQSISRTAGFLGDDTTVFNARRYHMRARQIGEELHDIGGIDLMKAAFYRILHTCGRSGELRYCWNEIGGWRS